MNPQPSRLRLGPALAFPRQSDDHIQAGIAQVQRVRVTLAPVADNRDGLALEQCQIAVLLVITLSHSGESLPLFEHPCSPAARASASWLRAIPRPVPSASPRSRRSC